MSSSKKEQTEYLTSEGFSRIPAEEKSGETLCEEPAVSVLMITWNHEPYIAKAIESIVCQEFDQPFELIIGEDCSTDETREVCEAFQEKYPDRIRLVTSPRNVGMHRNFSRIWHRARGRFIALCEGDDYWIDRRKLAKQVDWFVRHKAHTLCGTYASKIAVDSNGDWVENGLVGPCKEKEEYSVEDLIPRYSFHFSTVCLRRERVRFPCWLWDVYCVDRPLYLLCVESGPAGFIPDVTSVYRIHGGGIWGAINPLEKAEKSIHLFESLNRHFDFRFRTQIDRTLAGILWFYMSEAMERGDLKTARTLFRNSLSRHPRVVSMKLRSAVWLRLFQPRIYNCLKKVGGAGTGR